MIRISTVDGIFFVNGKEVRDILEYDIKTRLKIKHFKDTVEKQDIKIKSTYYERK